uniref:RNA-directed RNA polymerase n=1 Tax=Tzifr virus TaxID=2800945 RepID=A0A894KM81_9VIRU|nr:MAG: RNA-dependent RNA polymerase [Tzifr virus]
MLRWTEPPPARAPNPDLTKIEVDQKYQRQFVIHDGTMYCRTCVQITTSPKEPNLVRTVPGSLTSPYIPTRFFHPHLCTLATMKTVQQLYEGRHVPYDLFSSWFSINGGDYQMGNSPQCMALWEEFTHYHYRPQPPPHIDEVNGSRPRGFLTVRCQRHNGYSIRIFWKEVRSEADYEWLDSFWKWSSDADKAKTTLSAGQLMKHISRVAWAREKVEEVWGYLSASLANVTVTALLIHILGNVEAWRNFELLAKHRYCCLDPLSYQDLFKALSVAIRRTSHHPDGTPATLSEITSMAGWELAIGRSKNKTDWQDERRKRTEVTLHLGDPLIPGKNAVTNLAYLDEMRTALRRLMGQLVSRPVSNPSWLDYVMNRQSWLSSGSTGGQRVVLGDGSSIRANKHTYFETVRTSEMLSWLDSRPEIRATASEKFEMGKARAIYGTGVVDYSIHSYVLDGIEANLSRVDGIEYGLRGKAALATMVRRTAVVTRGKPECTNVDYADFNYQHTLQAQAIIYDELARSLELAGWHHDKVRAAFWCRDSLLKQYVKFPELRSGYLPTTQGMFSGFRGTNFLNTLANVAYFKVAQAHACRLFSLVPQRLFHSHLGDDVFIANESRAWAVALFNCMGASGLVFQPSKQMFEVSKGEFLRVVYTAEGCQGYLARKVATFIMKPIQNTDVVTPAERAVALNDQVGALVRRGLEVRASALLWDATIPYAASSKLAKGVLCVPRTVLLRHHLDNGLDLGHPFTAAVRGEAIPLLPNMRLESKLMAESLPHYMTDDWIRVVSRRFGQAFDAEKLREVVHGVNMTDSLRQEDRTACLRKYEKEMRLYLSGIKLKGVVRSQAEFKRLLDGPRAGKMFVRQLEELASNEIAKNARTDRSTLSCIMACIGQSAFKSLSTTKIATKSGTVEALLLCLSQAPDSDNKDRACQAVASIQGACGPEILATIVEGVGAGAGKYNAEFHPDVLSWIQSEAMELSIWNAVRRKVTSEAEFRNLVESDFDDHVRSARDHGLLKSISRY